MRLLSEMQKRDSFHYHPNSRYANRLGVYGMMEIAPRSSNPTVQKVARIQFAYNDTSNFDYTGEFETLQVVGSQGSIEALCKRLRKSATGICSLLDPSDEKPKELKKAVLECIDSFEKQTKDLKWNTEPPF